MSCTSVLRHVGTSGTLPRVADLDGLKALHAWMRDVGCHHAKCDGLELHLEPVPPSVTSLSEADAHAAALTQAAQREREALDELLLSGDGSVRDAILSLNRRTWRGSE